MRIVDKNYKPYSKDYSFSEGEFVIISDDGFCSYGTGHIIKVDNELSINSYPEYTVSFGYDPWLEEDTWILEEKK